MQERNELERTASQSANGQTRRKRGQGQLGLKPGGMPTTRSGKRARVRTSSKLSAFSASNLAGAATDMMGEIWVRGWGGGGGDLAEKAERGRPLEAPSSRS